MVIAKARVSAVVNVSSLGTESYRISLKVSVDNCTHSTVHLQERNHEFQFSSVTQSCPTLCDTMDYSTPGFPVHHQLPEFTQTHVHWVSDAIQFQYSLFEAIIEIMLNWLKDKHNNQKNRTEILETDPHKHSQLTFGKGTRATEWKKDSLFNKWCWSNWISSGN